MASGQATVQTNKVTSRGASFTTVRTSESLTSDFQSFANFFFFIEHVYTLDACFIGVRDLCGPPRGRAHQPTLAPLILSIIRVPAQFARRKLQFPSAFLTTRDPDTDS